MSGWGKCRKCRQRIYWGRSPYNDTKVFPFDDADEQQSHFQTCSATEWVVDDAGTRQRVSRCKACGTRVWWDTTPRGKRRPMDIEGDRAVWDCHFDTCAGAPPGAEPARPPTTLDPQDMLALHLATLGLTWPVSESEVTSAFRSLAMTHHPDMGGQASEFIRIKTAHDRVKELIDLAAGVSA